MTTSLKQATCVLAIGITLSSGVLLGQEPIPVPGNPRQTATPSAQQRADASAAFRESIRRAIAEQPRAVSGRQQQPLPKQSWAARHKGLLTFAAIVGVAFAVLVGFAYASCAGDEC
jgi:hypothetical protein